MEPTSEERNGLLLPLLYALLAIDGILTTLLIAGIVLFALRPAEGAVVQPDTSTAVAGQQPSYGPRTMISTYSIRAEERGWKEGEEDTVSRSQASPEPMGEPEPGEPEPSPEPLETPTANQPEAEEPQEPTESLSVAPNAGNDNTFNTQNSGQSTEPAQSNEGNDRQSNWDSGKVLGAAGRDVYHTHDCRTAQNILPENEVWFDSVEDAEAAGRRMCKVC